MSGARRGVGMAEATGTLKTTAAALRKAVPDLMEVAVIPDGQVCRLACTVSYSGDDPTNARGPIVVTRIEAVVIGSGKFRVVRSGLVRIIERGERAWMDGLLTVPKTDALASRRRGAGYVEELAGIRANAHRNPSARPAS